MNHYAYKNDFLENDYNYNEEEEESPIDDINEAYEESDSDNNQNDDRGGMFGVVDAINQNVAQISKNINETKMKQRLIVQKNQENLRRLNQMHRYNQLQNFDDNLNMKNQFPYTTRITIFLLILVIIILIIILITIINQILLKMNSIMTTMI